MRASIRERLLRLVPPDVRQVAAGNRKRHVDRRDLIDHDERRRVVGADEIPLWTLSAPVRPEIGAMMLVY